MLTSMYTAVSGMNANGTSLAVIGDNIANLNTVGFKSSRVAFGDILSQSITGASGSSQLGRGVEVAGISPILTQGSFETTSNGLDLAIDGDGFFMVNDNGAKFYTRAGQFSLNKDGNVVNPDGLILQGYIADTSGAISGTTGDMQIATRQSSANPTTGADITLNLNANAAIIPPAGVGSFTLDGNGDLTNNDPANFNFSTTINVFDTQGGSHPVTAYFVKTAANNWTVHYVQANPGIGQPLLDVGTQALSFNTNGALLADNSATAINFNFGANVAASSINFRYGLGTSDVSTQYSSDFAVVKLGQNGYAAGSLKSVSISGDGVISGIFTNGQTRSIGQVALARFISPTGLSKMGRNLYGESFDSGQPIIGTATTSGLGKVISNSLELSNVDLAEEFVKMISSQRGFQANSRVITTTDTLMQETVNLIR